MRRRDFLSITTTAAAGLALGCKSSGSLSYTVHTRLSSRPSTPTSQAALGLQQLGIGGDRDALLYVPQNYSHATATPLLVLFHGATSNGSQWFGSYRDRADALGCCILAPDSRSFTWDLGYESGRDVQFIDSALGAVFSRCNIDVNRIAVGGFSDGASYALSLGLANGDFFGDVVAYSPGFLVELEFTGRPRIWVSHGTQDAVLPIGQTSREIVPWLRNAGYDVTYREFDGPHAVPAEISTEAMTWLRGSW